MGPNHGGETKAGARCLENKYHKEGVGTTTAFYLGAATHQLRLWGTNETSSVQEQREQDCNIARGIVEIRWSRGRGGNQVGNWANANKAGEAGKACT